MENRFETLAEHSPNMIFINKGGRVVYVNRQCEEVMGYSKEEFYSDRFNFMDLIAPESKELVRKNFKKHMMGEEIPPYEYKILTREGKELTAIHTTKLIDYEGEKAVLGIITDITERRRAEESLKESEEKYRSIFMKAPVSIVLLNKDGQVIDINPYHVTNIGKGRTTREDYLGVNIITHPSIVNAGLCETYAGVLKGEPFDLKDVYFPTTTGGTDGYFNVKGVPLLKEGEVIGAITIHEDVTERKRGEKALQLVAEEWQRTFDSISDGVSIHDADRNIVKANKALGELLGIPGEELIGKKCYHAFHDKDKPIENCPMKRSMLSKKPEHLEAYEPHLRRWLSFSTSPIFDEEGKVKGTVHVVRDITARKQKEEELRKKTERIGVITELDRIISSSLDMSEVYDAFADGVKRLVDYDRISVALYDEEEDAIRMHLVRTKGKSRIPQGSWRPKEGTVIGHVIDTGKPFIRRDTHKEKEFMEDEAVVPEGLRSYIAVPLFSKGMVIGTFNLGSNRPNAYGEEDLEVLEDLSKQLAIAIENSRLYTDLKERVKELQKFHDLTVGRELKMIELKEKIKEIEEKLK